MNAPNLTDQATRQAPDFELLDTSGKPIRLSDYRGEKNVVLVLTRGFA